MLNPETLFRTALGREGLICNRDTSSAARSSWVIAEEPWSRRKRRVPRLLARAYALRSDLGANATKLKRV